MYDDVAHLVLEAAGPSWTGPAEEGARRRETPTAKCGGDRRVRAMS